MKRDWDSYWAFASDAHEPTVMTHALLSIFSSPKRIMTFLANRLAASWRAWLPALTVSLCLFACRLGRAETFHVSPKGTDAASGSQQDPFRTVQQAADVAQPGDVVLVRPGTYRERVSPPRGGSAGKPIVFRSVVRHGAIIKGSDLISGPWKEEADDIWSAAVSPELFTDTAHVDGGNVFEIPLSSTPWGREGRPEYLRSLENERGGNPNADPNLVFTLGQVFVNGHPLRQAGSSSELASATDTWWYERATRRLHVHLPPPLSPAEETVEITTRRRIFAPHKRGLGHIHLEGFVFEHCGNQYPTDFWMKEKPQQQGKRPGKAGNMQGYLHSRRDPRSQYHMQGQYHSHQGHGALRIGRHGPAHPSGNQQQDGALQQHARSSGLIAGLNRIDPTPPPEHDKKGCRQSDIPCARHQNDLHDRV
ncbi:MAG: DUF1565 domain-containing protein, partial [Planctomycetia bacterium]|nr:DUF1565 domain-containing protein [Planctomycetia bacterium]